MFFGEEILIEENYLSSLNRKSILNLSLYQEALIEIITYTVNKGKVFSREVELINNGLIKKFKKLFGSYYKTDKGRNSIFLAEEIINNLLLYVSAVLYTGRSDILFEDFLKVKIGQYLPNNIKERDLIIQGVANFFKDKGRDLLLRYSTQTNGDIFKTMSYVKLSFKDIGKDLVSYLDKLLKSKEEVDKESENTNEDNNNENLVAVNIDKDSKGEYIDENSEDEDFLSLIERIVEENKEDIYSLAEGKIAIEEFCERTSLSESDAEKIENIADIIQLRDAFDKFVRELIDKGLLDYQDRTETAILQEIFLRFYSNKAISHSEVIRILDNLSSSLGRIKGRSFKRTYLMDDDLITVEGNDLNRVNYTEMGVNLSIRGDDYIEEAMMRGELPLYSKKRERAKSDSGIILCLDVSNSMSKRHEGANMPLIDYGISMVIVAFMKALKDRRDFSLVLFGERYKVFTFPRNSGKIEKMRDFFQLLPRIRIDLEYDTSYVKALEGIKEGIKNMRFSKDIDLIFVSDGKPLDKSFDKLSAEGTLREVKNSLGRSIFLGVEENIELGHFWERLFDEIHSGVKSLEALNFVVDKIFSVEGSKNKKKKMLK